MWGATVLRPRTWPWILICWDDSQLILNIQQKSIFRRFQLKDLNKQAENIILYGHKQNIYLSNRRNGAIAGMQRTGFHFHNTFRLPGRKQHFYSTAIFLWGEVFVSVTKGIQIYFQVLIVLLNRTVPGSASSLNEYAALMSLLMTVQDVYRAVDKP